MAGKLEMAASGVRTRIRNEFGGLRKNRGIMSGLEPNFEPESQKDVNSRMILSSMYLANGKIGE